MAPSVQLDFFAANDLNGDVIFTMTDEDPYFEEIKLNIALHELGGGQFVTNRLIGDAMFDNGSFQPEVFVRVLIPEVSATRYQWGFFLDLRKQRLIDANEKGGERFTIGGPGPIFYLSRAALRPQQYTNSGWNIDLMNGVFRWNEAATAGSVLNRIINEDIAMPRRALVDMTNTFSGSQDSNGDAWTNEISENADEFELPIGQSFLDNLHDIQEAEDNLEVTMNLGSTGSPKMEFEAWQGYGRDMTAADVTDFGDGVVHLKEGVNIESDGFDASGTALRKVTHLIVHGLDRVYVVVEKPSYVDGGYVKYGYLEYGRTKNRDVLERRGLRWLRKQDAAEQEFNLPIKPGFDADLGLYFPSTHEGIETGNVWIGDTISVTTGTDALWSPLDYRAESARVTNIELTLRDAASRDDETAAARSWDVVLGLNHERKSDNRAVGTISGDGDAACACLKMCPSTQEASSATVEAFFRANADPGSTGLAWTGLLANQGDPGDGIGANGSDGYYFKSSSPSEWSNAGVFDATPGVDYFVQGWVKDMNGSTDDFKFGFFESGNPTELASHMLYDSSVDGATGGTWTFFTVGPFTAPVDTDHWRLGRNGAISFDEVTVTSGSPIAAAHPLHGSSGQAAHCDHIHHVFSETDDPTVDDDEEDGWVNGTLWVNLDTEDTFILVDQTAGAAVWIPLGGGGGGGGHDITEDGGSPLTARGNLDFRHGLDVTDDSGSDSTRVAVDESELTHNSLGGLTTGDPHTQYRLEADNHTHASSGAQGGTIDHGALTGLTDDDHPQYVLESIFAAKGDLLGASANDTPSIVAAGSEGQIPVQRAAATPGTAFEYQYASLHMVLGDGNAVVATGVKGYIRVPFDCTIVSATLLADVSGSIVVDIWKDTYANYPPDNSDSITASAQPTLSSAIKSEDTTLTGWTTALSAGDVLGINVDSASTVEQVTLALRVRRA